MMNIAKEIQDMTSAIEYARAQKANAEGQTTQILKNLKEVSGTDNIDKAQEKVSGWEEEIESMDTKINSLFDKLQKNYDW